MARKRVIYQRVAAVAFAAVAVAAAASAQKAKPVPTQSAAEAAGGKAVSSPGPYNGFPPEILDRMRKALAEGTGLRPVVLEPLPGTPEAG